MKVASSCWKALSDDMKQHWRHQAILEWEQSGGREKALLESERLKAAESNAKKRKPDVALTNSDGGIKGRKKRKPGADKVAETVVHPSRISFEAADAEGVSAMEQRIQQLTQTLSRVGRVLDRHRESIERVVSSQDAMPHCVEDAIHTPLACLSDDDVVYWIWRHDKGPVRSLLRACSSEKCISPSLVDALKATETKFSAQLKVEATSLSESRRQHAGLFPPDARATVTRALLEFRDDLCNGLLSMEGELRKYELENSRRKAKARRDAKKKDDSEKYVLLSMSGASDVRETVSSLLDWMIDTVVKRVEGSRTPQDKETVAEEALITTKDSPKAEMAVEDRSESEKVWNSESRETIAEDDFPLSPWLKHFADRWKIEAAADLLLFYAHTNTFFAIKPYAPLESTPIEVYARELGNAVPRSVVETAHEKHNDARGEKVRKDEDQSGDDDLVDAIMTESQSVHEKDSCEATDGKISQRKVSKSKSRSLCKPDDIITNVAITYRGDYVLSQLLQWYNGGIGQKPGLPDLLGCVLLPSMSGPWRGKVGGKSGKNKPTRYATEVRPMLLDWLKDPRKRGNPFEDALSQVFWGHAVEQTWDDAKFSYSPVGSPILDLLVTGDDASIRNIAAALFENIRSTGKGNESPENDKFGSASGRLQSTVDEGMPAQAVANWVQCENPDCLKWRKVPWHVDVDALPEKFYCSDNKWNPTANSCDSPEDEWDENDAQLKSEGIEKESDASMVATRADETNTNVTSAKQFIIGGKTPSL